MTVNVRAVIWVDGGLLVHKVRHRGEERVTLPGGRVKERETVERRWPAKSTRRPASAS